MNDVPNEIILQIGDYLDMKECISLSYCCKLRFSLIFVCTVERNTLHFSLLKAEIRPYF